jgi:hypothetical protein
MRTSNGTHAYREKCVANALALASSVPGPIRILPRDDDVDDLALPPEQRDAEEKTEHRRRFIASVTAAVHHGQCPRCHRKLPKDPDGSVITRCRCVPLCKKCHRLEMYWVAQTLHVHWLDDEREDEELLRRLDLLAR